MRLTRLQRAQERGGENFHGGGGGVLARRCWDFKSTHPHGVGLRGPGGPFRVRRFQSTHPHGVRQDRREGRAGGGGYFNPRTRTGCDPARSGPLRSPRDFNPRTRTGCDLFCSNPLTTTQRFQSTHPHGVRHTVPSERVLLRVFQSTHPHGVRLG